MNRLIHSRLFRGNFARNVTTMAGATAGGQFIVLLALPFLTRLYTSKEFGVAAAFAGIVGLFLVVATCRYEFAIPLPRRDQAAFHLVALTFLILSIVSPIAGASWLIVRHWINLDIVLADATFAILIAVGVFVAGAYQILSYWLVRRQAFGVVAITRVQQGVAGNGTQIAAGSAGFGTLGLIAGNIVGQGAGIVRLAAKFARDYRQTGPRIRVGKIKWAAKRYRNFPLFDTWAGLLSVGGTQAPILLFAALFSPAFAGYYALGYRFLSAPIGLVGKAVSTPLLSRLVEARRAGEVSLLTLRLLRVLAMLSLPLFAIMATVAPEFVPLAFGSKWAPAAGVVEWTALWVGWQFICSPLSVVLIATEKQRLNSLLQFGLVAARLLALLAGAITGSAYIALVGFSIASIFGYAAYTAAMGKAVGVSVKQMARAVFRPLIIASLCLPIAFAVPPDMVITRYLLLACVSVCWLFACWTSLRKDLFPASPDIAVGDVRR